MLQALEDAGIRLDSVVASSAGAIVGAAYNSGLRSAELLAAARALRVTSLIYVDPGGGGHLTSTSLDKLTARELSVHAYPSRFGGFVYVGNPAHDQPEE